jgi:ribosomal protein S27AE
MVTSNKDAAKIWKMIEDVKSSDNTPGRGPNDLEERIEDLMKIELSHRNLNAELRKEVRYQTDQAKFYKIKAEQLEKENKELRRMGANFIDEHRNKGNI